MGLFILRFIALIKTRVFLLLIVSFSRLLASPQEIPDFPDEVKQNICRYTFYENETPSTLSAERVRLTLLSNRDWAKAMVRVRAENLLIADLDRKPGRAFCRESLARRGVECYLRRASAADAKVKLWFMGPDKDKFAILGQFQGSIKELVLECGESIHYESNIIDKIQNYFKKINTEDFDLLMQMPYLQDLSLDKAQLKDQDIGRGFFGPSWVGSPLRRIELFSCDLSNKGLIRFTELLNLESLTLQNCPNITQINALKTAKGLRYLSVFRSPVSIQLAHAFKKARPEVDVVGRAGSSLSLFPLQDLPLDLIYSIGEFLNARDLEALMCANKGFSDILLPLRAGYYRFFEQNFNDVILGPEPKSNCVYYDWRDRKNSYDLMLSYFQAAKKKGLKVAVKMAHINSDFTNDSFWPYINFISHLDLSDACLQPNIFERLLEAKNLRVLILDAVRLQKDQRENGAPYFTLDVSPLAMMESLEHLSLAKCELVNTNSLVSLAETPHLKRLNLSYMIQSFINSNRSDYLSRFEDLHCAVANMRFSTSLTSLDLRGNKLTLETVWEALNIPTLQELFTDCKLSESQFTTVKSLAGNEAPMIFELPRSSSLTGLTLKIDDWAFEARLAFGEFPALKSLDLSMCYLSCFDFSALRHCEKVEHLSVDVTDSGQYLIVFEKFINDVARLSSLKRLHLESGIPYQDKSNFNGLAPLAGLPHLQEICIHSCRYTPDVNFDVFLSMPALQRLHIPPALFGIFLKWDETIFYQELWRFQCNRPYVKIYTGGKIIKWNF